MDDCIGKHRHNLVKRLSKQYSSLKLTHKPSSHPTPTVGFCYLYIECPYKLPWGREHEKKHTQSCGVTSLTSTRHSRLRYQSPEIRCFSEITPTSILLPPDTTASCGVQASKLREAFYWQAYHGIVCVFKDNIHFSQAERKNKTKQKAIFKEMWSSPRKSCHMSPGQTGNTLKGKTGSSLRITRAPTANDLKYAWETKEEAETRRCFLD